MKKRRPQNKEERIAYAVHIAKCSGGSTQLNGYADSKAWLWRCFKDACAAGLMIEDRKSPASRRCFMLAERRKSKKNLRPEEPTP